MKRRGFTLVELAIVIVILGILVLYAIPKYQGLIEEARSAQAKAQLGIVRSALAVYYAKNKGVFPATLDGSIFAEGQVPTIEATKADNSVIKNNSVKTIDGDGVVDPATDVDDAGGWVYDNGSTLAQPYSQADVRINAKGIDPVTGQSWYQY